MRLLRWFLGLLFIAVFLYGNFYYYQGNIFYKLINVILFSSLFVLFRVLFGPSPADRIIAVDILGVLIVGLLALLGLVHKQSFFMDIGLIWALMSFIASLAFAKILERRNLDE